MKQIVILSGKGGTGKTTVAAALAHLASREFSVILADADVDAANLELVLDPEKQETRHFTGTRSAVIEPSRCTACGRCAEVCRFEAIIPGKEAYRVKELTCEGCASCLYQCPAHAIRMDERQNGQWFRSNTRFGPLLHARLFAGQENSGKLVTLVKQQARLIGQDTGAALLLVDGPPGIGCPVIAASSGMDLALHIIEPTVSGVHDLERILATTDHFGVRSLVAINKADLNLKQTQEIAALCAKRGIEIAGHIPYDEVVIKAMVQGKSVTEYANGAVTEALCQVWDEVKKQLFPGSSG